MLPTVLDAGNAAANRAKPNAVAPIAPPAPVVVQPGFDTSASHSVTGSSGGVSIPANWQAVPIAVPHFLSTANDTGSTTPYGLTPNQIRGAYGLGTYSSGVLSSGISFKGIDGDGPARRSRSSMPTTIPAPSPTSTPSPVIRAADLRRPRRSHFSEARRERWHVVAGPGSQRPVADHWF